MASKEFRTGILITGDGTGAQKAIKLTAEQLDALKKKTEETSGVSGMLAASWAKSGISAQNFGKQLASLTASTAKWGAAAGIAAAAGAAAFIKHAIDTADATGKLAAQLGISTEAYSKLDYAAKLADVSQGAFESSIKRMTKTVAEAAAGSSSAAKALDALGLSAEDLLKLPADKQLGAIADRLNRVENASQRAALEMKIFGRAGLEMHNLIKEGSVGIARAGDELERFGGVIGPELAAKADAFNDNLDKLKAAALGAGLSVADELLPGMTEFSDRLVELAAQKETAEGIATFIEGIGNAVVFTAETVATTANVFKFLGEEIAALFNGPAVGDIARITERIDELKNKLEYFGDGTFPGDAAKVQGIKDEIAALERMLRVSEDLAASSARATAAAEAAKVARVQGAAVAAQAAEAERRHGDQVIRTEAVTRALTGSTEDLAQARAAAREEDMARIIAEEQATRASEAARIATEAQTEAMREATEQADPWAEALQGAAERIDSAFVDMWKNIGSGFDDFADSLKDSFKQLLAELAHQAITRPILVRFASAMGLGGGSSSAFASGGGGFDLGSLFNLGGMAKTFMGGFSGGGGLSGGFNALFGGAGGGLFSSLGNSVGGLYSGMGSIFGSLGMDSAALASNARGLMWTNGGMTGGQMLGNIGMNMAAGYLGGMAGNWLGSNVLTDGRQAQSNWGATAGGVIGSIWGPIGTAVGSAIGSLVDVAFGTDDTKRVRLGITAGDYSGIPSNLTDTQIGASGLKFMSEHNRTDDDGAGAKAMMDAFLGIDSTLTSISRSMGLAIDFSQTKLVNPRYVGNSNVQAGFFGTALNNEMDAAGLKNATKEFIAAWLDQIEDELPERVRAVMRGSMKKTAEEIVSLYGYVADIDRMLSIDVLKNVADAAEQSAKSILDAYDEATQSVVDLAAEYDGSVDSMKALTEALATQKNVAQQLAAAYADVASMAESTFGNAITAIEESLLTDEELYQKRRAQIEYLTSALPGQTDPAKLAQTIALIDNLAGSAWGLLDETQQQTMGPEFLAFLHEAQALVEQQIEAGREALGDREEAVQGAIDLELMRTAALTQQAAADTFSAAVGDFADIIRAIGAGGLGGLAGREVNA